MDMSGPVAIFSFLLLLVDMFSMDLMPPSTI